VRSGLEVVYYYEVKTNNIAMFADDTKTYQEIKSVDDVASLQDDLDRLDAW
jgi:hypothetical protein